MEPAVLVGRVDDAAALALACGVVKFKMRRDSGS